MKHTRLRRRNPERLARRRAQQFGPQAQRCRESPCCACGSPAPSDPAHIRTRASLIGEPLSVVDRANVVPLCRSHHIEQGTLGISRFELKRGISMQRIADRIAAQLEDEGATWD